MLGLHCSTKTFSSCSMRASLLQHMGSRAWGSVVTVAGLAALQHVGSYFPDRDRTLFPCMGDHQRDPPTLFK